MINKFFEVSKKEQKLISLVMHGEEGFWCGVVVDYNEDFVQLKHYTKYGELDGVVIEKVEDIQRVDLEDDYINAMSLIIEHKESIRSVELKSRIFDELDDENWQLVSLKPYSNDKNVLVRIQLDGDFYYGFVLKISEAYLQFHLISTDGISEGMSLFKVEDITSIKVNDLECRKRLLVYKKTNR